MKLGDRLKTWTARAWKIDPKRHPRTLDHVATRGRLPSFVRRWGTARSLQAGPLARLVGAVGGDSSQLVAVSVLPPVRLDSRSTAAAYRAALGHFDNNPAAPALGVLALEWSARAGYHYEGITTPADAARLVTAGYDVNMRPLEGLEGLQRQAKYMSKGCRRDTPQWARYTYTEHYLALMADLGASRLPPRFIQFGLTQTHELGHTNNERSPSAAPTVHKRRPTNPQKGHALELLTSGTPPAEVARLLNIPAGTIRRWKHESVHTLPQSSQDKAPQTVTTEEGHRTKYTATNADIQPTQTPNKPAPTQQKFSNTVLRTVYCTVPAPSPCSAATQPAHRP